MLENKTFPLVVRILNIISHVHSYQPTVKWTSVVYFKIKYTKSGRKIVTAGNQHSTAKLLYICSCYANCIYAGQFVESSLQNWIALISFFPLRHSQHATIKQYRPSHRATNRRRSTIISFAIMFSLHFFFISF